MITSDQVGRVLIDGGAAVDAKNKIGQTPLIYACIEQHLDMVKLLLQVEKGKNHFFNDYFYALPTRKREEKLFFYKDVKFCIYGHIKIIIYMDKFLKKLTYPKNDKRRSGLA